jgi:apolipoprotein N-acyltransferase
MASYLFELSYTLIVVGLVFFFLRKSELYLHSWKKRVLHWMLFGFIVNLYGLSWLYTVYPLPWLPEGPLQFFGIFLLHFILSSATSLPYGLLALSHTKKIRTHWKPFVFASLLTLSEIFRSLIISILYKGEGTTIALHFTAGTIGNALSTTPLIEFAYFGGTFALTFTLGYLVAVSLSKQSFLDYKYHTLTICILLVCTHYLIPIHTLPQKTTVGIITTDFVLPKKEEEYGISLQKQEKPLHALTLSLASVPQSKPMFVVYPEDTRFIATLSPTHKTDLLAAFPKTLFIDGDTIYRNHAYSNVSLLYNPKSTDVFVRGKELLMPFNEYIPYFFRPLFLPFVAKDSLEKYANAHTYTPIHGEKTFVFSGVRVGTLICSEILSYSLIQNLREEKPDIVFYQAHLQVFHNNPWFVMHLRSFSKVAAAELRTTLISSTSGAPSYTISPYGTILFTIGKGNNKALYQE